MNMIEEFFRGTPQRRRKELMNELFDIRAKHRDNKDLVALIETLDRLYHKVKEEES